MMTATARKTSLENNTCTIVTILRLSHLLELYDTAGNAVEVNTEN